MAKTISSSTNLLLKNNKKPSRNRGLLLWQQKTPNELTKGVYFICGTYFFLLLLIAACAAARRAIGTRYGEQET